MKTNIYFDKRYFFDKQEFGDYIEKILSLNNSVSISDSRKEELFYLYLSGKLGKFCGLHPTETEMNAALQAIKEHFELSAELSINIDIKNYCSVNTINIKNTYESDKRVEINEIKQRKAIQSFIVSPFYLNFNAVQEGNFIFIVNYIIHDAIPQKLFPVLEFYSEGVLIHKYTSIDAAQIDLSQKEENSICFEIPLIDIFKQRKGEYIIKFGSSAIASIEFPRCGLPINDGIYSFPQLCTFCKELTGSPTADLFSLYELFSNRFLEIWLQDSQEEGEYKKKISKCIDDIIDRNHQFKVNDINSVLDIICQHTIEFPMSEYISVNIKKMKAEKLVGKQTVNKKDYYFVHWNSKTDGEITVNFNPIVEWNIDFDISVRTSSKKISNFTINLEEITNNREYNSDVSFSLLILQNDSMGENQLYIGSKGNYQPTNTYIVVTGEKIDIPLSGITAISMVGIYSLDITPHSYYIAQTTLTQKQVRLLIEIAKEKGMECNKLIETFECAISHDGNNENLPCSCFTGWCLSEINKILNTLLGNGNYYKFQTPYIEDLVAALHDGIRDGKYSCPINRQIETLRPDFIDPIHSTKLGILNLFGNILSITNFCNMNYDAIIDKLLFDMNSQNNKQIMAFWLFGTAYGEHQHDNFIRKSDQFECYYIGYRPKMVIYEDSNNPSIKIDNNLSDTTILDVDEWQLNQLWNEPDF